MVRVTLVVIVVVLMAAIASVQCDDWPHRVIDLLSKDEAGKDYISRSKDDVHLNDGAARPSHHRLSHENSKLGSWLVINDRRGSEYDGVARSSYHRLSHKTKLRGWLVINDR